MPRRGLARLSAIATTVLVALYAHALVASLHAHPPDGRSGAALVSPAAQGGETPRAPSSLDPACELCSGLAKGRVAPALCAVHAPSSPGLLRVLSASAPVAAPHRVPRAPASPRAPPRVTGSTAAV